MPMTTKRALSSITREEWIIHRWIEVTVISDQERQFIDGWMRTPDEAYQAMIEWDAIDELRTQYMNTVAKICEIDGCYELAVYAVQDFVSWIDEEHFVRVNQLHGTVHVFCKTHNRKSKTYSLDYSP